MRRMKSSLKDVSPEGRYIFQALVPPPLQQDQQTGARVLNPRGKELYNAR